MSLMDVHWLWSGKIKYWNWDPLHVELPRSVRPSMLRSSLTWLDRDSIRRRSFKTSSLSPSRFSSSFLKEIICHMQILCTNFWGAHVYFHAIVIQQTSAYNIHNCNVYQPRRGEIMYLIASVHPAVCMWASKSLKQQVNITVCNRGTRLCSLSCGYSRLAINS